MSRQSSRREPWTKEEAKRRRRFMVMLREVEREADRKGTYTIDQVVAELDKIIEASRTKGRVRARPVRHEK
jgi:hypothetical protein